jgi:hypothetical protein
MSDRLMVADLLDAVSAHVDDPYTKGVLAETIGLLTVGAGLRTDCSAPVSGRDGLHCSHFYDGAPCCHCGDSGTSPEVVSRRILLLAASAHLLAVEVGSADPARAFRTSFLDAPAAARRRVALHAVVGSDRDLTDADRAVLDRLIGRDPAEERASS